MAAIRFEKMVLRETGKPYAPCALEAWGQRVLLAAPVDRGACYAFFPPYDDGGQVLWEESGTMNIVPVPGEPGAFLSTRHFFSGFNAPGAYVSLSRPVPGAPGQWTHTKVLEQPYLHRFDVIAAAGERFFVGCTLCTHKEYTDDWSTSGAVWVGKLPDDLTQPWQLHKRIDGLYKNHGYTRTVWDGAPAFIATAREGAFLVRITGSDPAAWPVEKLLEGEISDIAVFDLDGDGRDELITIQGFHGDDIYIYKQDEKGSYQRVFHMTAPQGHVAWGGMLGGQRSVLLGHCSGDCALLLLQPAAGEGFRISTQVIDTGIGPRNIAVYRDGGRDYILSTNWGCGEIARYEVL